MARALEQDTAAGLRCECLSSTKVRRLLRLYHLLGNEEQLQKWQRFLKQPTPFTFECHNNDVHLLTRLLYREEIVGAAYLLGNIYVVLKGSPRVLVYNGHNPYDFMDDVPLPGTKTVDIATSYADICVYVLDDGKGQVIGIGQDHSVTTVVGGLQRGNLLSMSVTMDGRLIIVDKSSKVLKYTKEGTLIGIMQPAGLNIFHAVEVEDEMLVVCDGLAIAKTTKGGLGLVALSQEEIACHYVSRDRNGNLIASDYSGHRVVQLDSVSLQVTSTLLTLDRDGIEKPVRAQCVLENGMMLVCWIAGLDVYSFTPEDTQGYLASSEHEIKMQRTLEVEQLESEIAQTDTTFRRLVSLCRDSEMGSISYLLPLHESSILPLVPSLRTSCLPDTEVQGRIEQEVLNRLFSFLSRQSWATQYYHDVAEDVVRVAVEAPHKLKALHRLTEESFPSHVYQICDPWESTYTPHSDSAGRQCQTSQRELSPSTKINCKGKSFLFGGAVANRERGITVAHAIEPGDNIVLDSDHASSFWARKIVGECREAYEKLVKQNGEQLSADLALLKLKLRTCSVDNTVRWPFPSGRTLQIKVYKGERVPDDTRVMILDQNGDFKYGNIRRDHLTDERLRNNDLHNVLAISAKRGPKEVSITRDSDSGAVVMSLPSNANDVVYVYGIVMAIYEEPTNHRSLTVANSLWDVIHELCTNRSHNSELHSNNIDFT